MMQLKEIRIKNFKIVQDSSQLPLQPLTLLIGRNGSGKSSVIEALDWLSHAVYSGAQSATEPFQRIRDIVKNWEPDTLPNFHVELVFDTEDFSEGNVFYKLSVGANDTVGEIPQINYEELYTDSGNATFIQTDEGNRRRRVNTADELLKAADLDRLALTDMDPIISRGGDLLKSFLERSVFLRLNPRAIASFAPAR